MVQTTAVPAIQVESVDKIFGNDVDRVVALNRVSVAIEENEFFTLLGPSGCGKTTLLRLIAGFEQPTSGRILLEGEDITRLAPYDRPVNTVFQSYALFPHMTVEKNISFALEMLEKPAQEIAATVDSMLKLVRMEALRDRKIDQISGGQQQRVALARALAPHPTRIAARRTAVGARLQAAQGHADRAQTPAERNRDYLRLRHPRPGGSVDHVRPGRGDERRQHPADRRTARDLRPPERALRRRLHRRHQFPGGGYR